jgi:hypothetical protein
LKTPVPATMTLAPASADASMVSKDKPPSTSISRLGYLERSNSTYRFYIRINISTWLNRIA